MSHSSKISDDEAGVLSDSCSFNDLVWVVFFERGLDERILTGMKGMEGIRDLNFGFFRIFSVSVVRSFEIQTTNHTNRKSKFRSRIPSIPSSLSKSASLSPFQTAFRYSDGVFPNSRRKTSVK